MQNKLSSTELREKFISFFLERGHKKIPSSSLLPENDPTVLFITAGMQPLVPFLMGEEHPLGNRLVGAQKCIRTDDIDEVGDSVHHTFFEMLGNWSLGDYFKNESIQMSHEFLTDSKWLGLDKERLAVSVFAGDEDSPFDQEAYDKWTELGFSENKIAKMAKAKNWWGPAGVTGPCGPDTEIFYWTGKGAPLEDFQGSYDDASWVEVWNNVFIQYNKNEDGKFTPMKQKNVDTGMGLERMLAVMNRLDDNYRTDLFWPIILKLEELSGKQYDNSKKEFRIIADHIKASVFAIGDGVFPSNKGAGYIVRRLIRRAIVKAKELGIETDFTEQLAKKIFEIYASVYFKEEDNFRIIESLNKEEAKFRRTLKDGLRLIESINEPSGKNLFDLYQSFGIPLELSQEEFKKRNIFIEKKMIEEFSAHLKQHQDLSRTASAGMFKGGLADSSEETKKLHTAAHLLLESLRRVLGDHVAQKGSNITPERLRFDFSHPEKLTSEQLEKVESMVNQQIQLNLPVTVKEMTLQEARDYGATGVFENKYGEIVKVYTMGDPSMGREQVFSKEICGGPHVNSTGELGKFTIKKEESSSSGVRRIKGTLE